MSAPSSQASTDFTGAQKAYLSGFISGILNNRQFSFVGQTGDWRFTSNVAESSAEMVYGTPVEDLCREELVKHEKHGLDSFDSILADARDEVFPKDGDLFRYKFHGLFYVTPAEESLMMLCRIAGGTLDSRQLRGLANLAADLGNGFLDLTTRANVQIRGILPIGAPSC